MLMFMLRNMKITFMRVQLHYHMTHWPFQLVSELYHFTHSFGILLHGDTLALNCIFFSSQVTDANLEDFLSTDQDNKPKVILCSSKPAPSLLYNLVAFSYQRKLTFGYVTTGQMSSNALQKRFRVHAGEPTVLVFKEESAVPEVVVQVSRGQVTRANILIDRVFRQNLLRSWDKMRLKLTLLLPSSKSMFSQPFQQKCMRYWIV